jgi:exonuclease SbcD
LTRAGAALTSTQNKAETGLRILHTADWHLGKTLHGMPFHSEQEWLLTGPFLDILRDRRPDLVVIAGDIYDRALPPGDSVALLGDVLDRILRQLGIPVLLTAGNHDDPQRLGFAAPLLQAANLHIVECPMGRVLAFPDAHGPVWFACAGFGTPALLTTLLGREERFPDHDAAFAAAVANLSAQIPPGARRVYVGHAFVQGGEESESERPVQIGGGGLVRASHLAGFAYAALGHLHRPQAFGTVAYSGSPLAYSFSEVAQAKSVSLVEIGADGVARAERIPLTPRRRLRELRGDLATLLAKAEGEAREDWLSLIITERDSSAIHRLRDAFPHVLQHRFETAAPSAPTAMARRSASDPLIVMEEFWRAIGAEPWSEAERAIAREAIEGAG